MKETPEARSLRALIVDDEPPARRVLHGLLTGEPGVEVVGAYGNGEEAIRALVEEEVDVVFLDIQMPETTGFEVLEAIDEKNWPLVVFVTAYDEHAVRAFEVGAVDYLLKPFDDERFSAVLARVRNRAALAERSDLRRALQDLSRRLADAEGTPDDALPQSQLDDRLERIPIRTGKRVRFLDIDEVDWIEAVDYYARLHTSDGSHLLRETLTRLESRLDPKEFVRVHRSAIVRIRRVKELLTRDSDHYEVRLADGTAIRVSRSRRARVMRTLGLDATDVSGAP